MTMRKLMIPAAGLLGVVAIGYGALIESPASQEQLAPEPGAHPGAAANDEDAADAAQGMPRECRRDLGIVRNCTYQ
ncbi:MAG TPA: hypothetical protein VFP44_13965 [Usitatibacter sp.]|nr:hypothetical protein [Usitatibacter sp.]